MELAHQRGYEYGVNAQPSGQQISGSVSCVDPSAKISVDAIDTISMNITYNGFQLPAVVTANLAVGKLIGRYFVTSAIQTTFIWFTITDEIIPNAMEVP